MARPSTASPLGPRNSGSASIRASMRAYASSAYCEYRVSTPASANTLLTWSCEVVSSFPKYASRVASCSEDPEVRTTSKHHERLERKVVIVGIGGRCLLDGKVADDHGESHREVE